MFGFIKQSKKIYNYSIVLNCYGKMIIFKWKCSKKFPKKYVHFVCINISLFFLYKTVQNAL